MKGKWVLALLATSVAACGVVGENNTAANNTTANNTTANNTTANNTTANNTTTNNTTTNNTTANNTTTNNTATGGWQRFTIPNGPGDQTHEDDDVRGIYCETADKCVVGTYSTDSEGVILAASMAGLGEVLFDGEALSMEIGAGWTHQVLGFQETALGVAARMNNALNLIYADGDMMNAANWKRLQIGTDFSYLNAQLHFASSGGTWRYLYNGVLFGADAAPAAGTVWTGLWSPNRIPPFPADWLTQKAAAPTLCDTSPSIYFLPKVGDVMYSSPDLNFMVYTAAAVNSEASTDVAGVCVSTDKGLTFHNVAFPGAEDEYGPRALTCTDKDHCWAVNGLSFDDDSHYVYYSTNASAGAASTWSRGTLPSNLVNGSAILADVDFATNQVGYIVGNNDNDALVLKTTDGGATWTDISGPVQALADTTKLWAVFALDANNVLVGGEHGAFLTNSNGGAP